MERSTAQKVNHATQTNENNPNQNKPKNNVGNYEFGISRVMKSLEPQQKKLGRDTWHYAKRCFLALLDMLHKQLITVKDDTLDVNNIITFFCFSLLFSLTHSNPPHTIINSKIIITAITKTIIITIITAIAKTIIITIITTMTTI